MSDALSAGPVSGPGTPARREQVLAKALVTFAGQGYRSTSMEEVARAAGISRPGLYFFFRTKQELFRAAIVRGLEKDLAAAERVLADDARPLGERLLAAFDHWAGQYVGAMTRDVTAMVAEHPDLLGSSVTILPRRFADLVTGALLAAADTAASSSRSSGAGERGRDRARVVAATLLSTAIGVKQQVATRQEFLDRMAASIGLLVR